MILYTKNQIGKLFRWEYNENITYINNWKYIENGFNPSYNDKQ